MPIEINLRVYKLGFATWLWEYAEEGSIIVTRMEPGAGWLTHNRALARALKEIRKEYRNKEYIVNMVQNDN